MRAIYNDPRAGHKARELLLAVAYAVYLGKTEDGVSPLREARRVLGRNSIGRPRYDDLVAADAPRYAPPRAVEQHAHLSPCEAPRLRPYRPRPGKPYEPDPDAPVPIRPYELPPELAALKEEAMATYTPPRDWRTEDGVCGANSYRCVEEKDPRTGWVIAHWFCKRHADHADRVAEQVREQNEAAPEPVPNTGGLLPCYFKADWEKVYRHYAGKFWEPPRYGLCADDWPAPGETFQAHRRLRMVLGGEPAED
ncbi:hypothetical protein ACFC8N_43085 [Streptomyces sp. NPDC055966]|uniref:hypothetical protein n=1 Tax=Streptomyces sp. NPDC055966 TaxID=3345669 RepID=UPI0035DC2671